MPRELGRSGERRRGAGRGHREGRAESWGRVWGEGRAASGGDRRREGEGRGKRGVGSGSGAGGGGGRTQTARSPERRGCAASPWSSARAAAGPGTRCERHLLGTGSVSGSVSGFRAPGLRENQICPKPPPPASWGGLRAGSASAGGGARRGRGGAAGGVCARV